MRTVHWLRLALCLLPAHPAAAELPRIDLYYGSNEIYPSALASATDDALFPPPRTPAAGQSLAETLGDPRGLIGVVLTAPADDCRARVTVAATAIFAASTITARLPKAGHSYRLAPRLRLDHDRLLRLHHPIPSELLVADVELAGQHHHLVQAVRIHALNDCPIAVTCGATAYDTSYLAAAFVNEYNPSIARVVEARALARGRVARFDGYESGDRRRVEAQVRAIYDTLADLGFKYSSEIQGSVVSSTTTAQWVRQVGETLRNEQANCLDGTALFASALTQINLRVVLYLIPLQHAFLGIYLDPASRRPADLIALDPTRIGRKPYAQAVADGEAERKAEFQRHGMIDFTASDADARLAQRAHTGWVTGLYAIDVAAARRHGILPLAESVP